MEPAEIAFARMARELLQMAPVIERRFATLSAREKIKRW